MFDFLFYRKRSEVTRILTGRVNSQTVAGLHPGERRVSRSSICEVVWLIRLNSRQRPDFPTAIPVISKDISPQGLALVHTQPIEDEHVLIGLRREEGMVFLKCRVEHTTSLGCGFFQIGCDPEETVAIDEEAAAPLRQAYEKRERLVPATVG